MFSHYTAIRIKHNCYQIFFSKSCKCSLCLFLLNSVLISQKQYKGFFFHSSSVLNNKDLIILTFITIAGLGLCEPVDERIIKKIDAPVNEGVKDTREMKR